jgi:hypothetical protein
MIGLIKKQLWRIFEGKKLSHEETVTLLAEAVQKINSRPITLNPRSEGEPLCVQDLMLGRAKPGQVEVKFKTGKQLVRRFENVQRTQQEFWKRWRDEVFPEMLKQSKWKRDKRDLEVGDIVLRKDETAAGQTYKYAKVVKVHTSVDGKVRAADIEYRLPGESVFRTTTRPIHKLILVVPAEEQTVAGSREGGESVEADPPTPLAVQGPGPAQQEEVRAIGMAPLAAGEPEQPDQEEAGVTEAERSPQGTAPQPDKERQREPKAVVKYKKVISRKKAGKQVRTNTVSVPKEEGEIVDVGVRPRKGGDQERPLAWIHRIRARGVFRIPVKGCARTL